MARSRVEVFEQIRRDRRIDGLSIRELANRHGVHRRTVRQALASAVPPANPASTWSLCRRRTLRAVDLITILPSVTWPSPPMATEVPRRTDRIVVP